MSESRVGLVLRVGLVALVLKASRDSRDSRASLSRGRRVVQARKDSQDLEDHKVGRGTKALLVPA